jgi:hypothetical protein
MDGAVMKRRRGHPLNRHARRGAVVVEFAVVLPLLALLVFGIIEFGHVFFVRQGLINAARVGARTATLCMDDDQRGPLVVARVQQALANGGLSGYNIAIDYVLQPPPSNAHVVTVSVPYSEVTLLGAFFAFSDFTLRSSCAMFGEN